MGMKRSNTNRFKHVKKRRLLKNEDSSDDEGESQPPISIPDFLPKVSKTKEKIFSDGNHIYFRDKVTFETIGKLIILIAELMAYDYIKSSNIPIYTVAEGEAV